MFQYTIPSSNYDPTKQPSNYQPPLPCETDFYQNTTDWSSYPKYKVSTSLWDEEGTVCYQVDVRGISVARRQDNDMINGTKLLNVTGMSRGKRDGILKNERGRVVVKVGAMHLKGVWITFARAKALAVQYSIIDLLYPLFAEDPNGYFYPNHLPYFYPQSTYMQQNMSHTEIPDLTHHSNLMSEESLFSVFSQEDYYMSQVNELPSAPSVPSMLPIQYSNDTMNYYY